MSEAILPLLQVVLEKAGAWALLSIGLVLVGLLATLKGLGALAGYLQAKASEEAQHRENLVRELATAREALQQAQAQTFDMATNHMAHEQEHHEHAVKALTGILEQLRQVSQDQKNHHGAMFEKLDQVQRDVLKGDG